MLLLHFSQKILYLVDEIKRWDRSRTKETAAQAIIRLAKIYQTLFDRAGDDSPATRTEPSLLNNSFPRLFNPSYQKLKPHWELSDDEVRLVLNDKLQDLHLNSQHNPLYLLKQVIQEYPDSIAKEEALYTLAEAYQRRNQFEKAEAVYKKLIELSPVSSLGLDAKTQLEMLGNSSEIGRAHV